MLRTLAERLGRGIVLKRRLPAEFGRAPLFVSPDAQLKYAKPGATAFDEELLRLATTEVREHSVVWDIGANVGVFSIAAASLAKRGCVLAVEPDIWLAALIRRSAALPQNAALKVDVLPAAVSGRIGVASLLIAARGRASNALESARGRTQMGGIRARVPVPTLTLDCLLESFPVPDLVKIDVEGAERDVLEGASRLLAQARPTIYIEVGAEAAEGVAETFRRHGYRMFDPSSPHGRRTSIVSCAFNTLAIPGERLGQK